MTSPAIERLKHSSAFLDFAKTEFATHHEIWQTEAKNGTGIAGALGVAICAIGGDEP